MVSKPGLVCYTFTDYKPLAYGVVVIFFLRNKKEIKKFLLIVGTVVVVYFVSGLAIVLAVSSSVNKIRLPEHNALHAFNPINDDDPDTDDTPAGQPDEGSLIRPPARTNFLLAGIDENNLTDTLIVGCFYRDSAEIRMMAIPRDLYTRIPEERLTRMRADGLRPPNTLKINSIRSYGRAFGIYYLTDQLGEMLGVSFNYYAEIEISSFVKIVDAVGGVWMDVPIALRYEDECQNLFIDISPGMQHFNGTQAEGLVRFRSYPSGDLGRNAVQMEFMKQLMRQTLTREAIMRDPMTLADFVLNDIQHNVGVDALRYLPYVTELKSESIKTFVMPGESRYINRVSYFVADDTRLPEVVQQVFYASAAPQAAAPEQPSPRPSHGKNIQILNGSRVAGLGSEFKDILTHDGYTVVATDSYGGTHENSTRIRTRALGDGEDLIPYFNTAVLSQDENMPPEYDIIIIIGRGE
jgi:LCP family protein required for cell wall assembly